MPSTDWHLTTCEFHSCSDCSLHRFAIDQGWPVVANRDSSRGWAAFRTGDPGHQSARLEGRSRNSEKIRRVGVFAGSDIAPTVVQYSSDWNYGRYNLSWFVKRETNLVWIKVQTFQPKCDALAGEISRRCCGRRRLSPVHLCSQWPEFHLGKSRVFMTIATRHFYDDKKAKCTVFTVVLLVVRRSIWLQNVFLKFENILI